jgi:CRP/FNR family transcriptional regulator
MTRNELGSLYAPGEVIVRHGEIGDCMYVIQSGRVEAVQPTLDGGERQLRVMGENEFFGEMAIFEREPRSATVRALDEARVLKVDTRTLLRRMKEDPTLAFNILETLSRRIRQLSEVAAAAEEVRK